MEYQARSEIANYFDVMRIKTKALKLMFPTDEITSSGGDNTESEQPLRSVEEGDTSDNAGVLFVSLITPTLSLLGMVPDMLRMRMLS